jgi:hypothetical protein
MTDEWEYPKGNTKIVTQGGSTEKLKNRGGGRGNRRRKNRSSQANEQGKGDGLIGSVFECIVHFRFIITYTRQRMIRFYRNLTRLASIFIGRLPMYASPTSP